MARNDAKRQIASFCVAPIAASALNFILARNFGFVTNFHCALWPAIQHLRAAQLPVDGEITPLYRIEIQRSLYRVGGTGVAPSVPSI